MVTLFNHSNCDPSNLWSWVPSCPPCDEQECDPRADGWIRPEDCDIETGVFSVNGKTGVVVITLQELGGISEAEIISITDQEIEDAAKN